MRRVSWLVVVAVLGAAAAGAAWFTRPAGGPATVLVMDGSFSPATLAVRAGTTVRWVSRSQILHTTTSFDGLWDSPNISHDQSYAFTFATPGEYRYLCRQHLLQGMIATVVVK